MSPSCSFQKPSFASMYVPRASHRTAFGALMFRSLDLLSPQRKTMTALTMAGAVSWFVCFGKPSFYLNPVDPPYRLVERACWPASRSSPSSAVFRGAEG